MTGFPFGTMDDDQIAATHVQHAMRMVRACDPAARARFSEPPLLRLTALEAQLINVRAILDFLEAEPPRVRKDGQTADDVTAHHYVPTWAGVQDQAFTERLRFYREVTNKFVAHLTWTRVRSLREPGPNLDTMADEVQRAYDEFRSALDRLSPERNHWFETPTLDL